MIHVMLDLETWGLLPGSHLRSIGAVVFDPNKGTLGAEFYCNILSEPSYGLVRDEATVAWWAEQSEAAQAALQAKQLDLAVALKRFAVWLASLADEVTDLRIWAHGPHFDFVLTEAAYRAVEMPVPWTHRAPRDCRTMLEAAGMNARTDFPAVGTEHNALDDAKSQALGVMEAFHRLRVQA